MLLIKLMLAFALVSGCAAARAQSIILGAVAMDAPVEMIKRMKPLTAYLAQQTGYTVEFRPSPNLETAVKDLGEGRVHLAYLTPIAYMMAHDQYQARALVAPLTYGEPNFKLVVVVHKDSEFKNLEDLKGKRFAFGDPKAYLQPAVLLDAGIQRQDFSTVAYLKHYDNIAKAILLGDFDGGIMKDTVYDKFASQGLRAVYFSPPLASYVFTVNGTLPFKIQNKLKSALMALNKPSPQTKAVLKALDQGYVGFQSSSNKDYDAERLLISRLRISGWSTGHFSPP